MANGVTGEDVYCTLVMTDAYLPGAAVLAHSLRDASTTKKLACLVTQDSLRSSTIAELRTLYDYVIPVERIGNPSPANLYLMDRPDLLYAFTKIHLWSLTQFRKVVYVDADIVALRAPDELFEVKDDFAAAPDIGWPDAFNTGVMALTPNVGVYSALRTLAAAGDSFDGADQGLLNQYFEHKAWKRLSFTYNCTPSASYQYEPAYRYHKSGISMVHFIGSGKPWQRERSAATSGSGGGSGVYQELLSRWWAVYDRHVRVSTYEYTATGRREHDAARQKSTLPHSEAPTASTEPLFTDAQSTAEALSQGHIDPTPTSQQRKFSAPSLEWDATRAAPPASSKPEAANFPHKTYEFSSDPQPFKAPAKYPEPPRDMWYEVPQSKPKPLPAIFPWEERREKEGTRVARVFAQEEPLVISPSRPQAVEDDEDDFLGGDELAVTADDEEQRSELDPQDPMLKKSGVGWDAFGASNRNAWDEVSGIEDYVRALTAFQKNKGAVQVIHPPSQPLARTQQTQQHILSPSNEPDPVELVEKIRQRRESLLLTDFPSASDRPSLSVTPAPRRRASFWGSDREEEGDSGLLPADGVPEQRDWNPDTQLEALRRNSLTVDPSQLSLPNKKKSIPSRKMPGSIQEEPLSPVGAEISSDGSMSVPSTALGDGSRPHGLDAAAGPLDGTIGSPLSPSMTEVAEKAGLFEPEDTGLAPKEPGQGKVQFSEPGFGGQGDALAKDSGVELSPTETKS
ncbi:glycogenin glucosyltransferase [Teratosphaeriaceae sp. CCFEE 6253]|nr:glycogenin glucosyltransferase [Teratosphaeriaceae sp. CCFEE 6253]